MALFNIVHDASFKDLSLMDFKIADVLCLHDGKKAKFVTSLSRCLSRFLPSNGANQPRQQ